MEPLVEVEHPATDDLQDRLVKELRLAGISDMEAASAFLPGFIERHNARFAKLPARSDDIHRALNIEHDRPREVLCLRDQRKLGENLMLTYERKRITLEDNELSRALAGSYIDVYEFPDCRLQVRGKGVALPFRAFNKVQRVSHAAIVENKRLGAVLAHIRA